jgi:serine phosphatase RsbU (regulator of sigma subunit)
MNFLKKYWQQLKEIGVTPNLSFAQAQRIGLLNQIWAVGIVVIFSYIIPFVIAGHNSGVLVNVTTVMVGSLVILSNYKKKHLLARLASGIYLPLYFFAICLLFADKNINLLLFPTAILAIYLSNSPFEKYFLFMYNVFVFFATYYVIDNTLFYLPTVAESLEKTGDIMQFLHYSNVVLAFFILYLATHLFKFENDKYLYAIEQANEDILHKNEEINQINAEITTQRDNIITQKELIERKSKQITDSITYAKRIQNATLVSQEALQTLLPNSFVYYKPKDIVSGDFYWVAKHNHTIFFAVADCTGHGVPGCLMAIIGINMLQQIVTEMNISNPAQVLTLLDKKVIALLKQDKGSEIKDGMDIALCQLAYQTQELIQEPTLLFASAQRPLYVIRNQELTEYKGNKIPIGNAFYEEKTFDYKNIPIQKNDLVYIFSDGITDQFDATDTKKYSTKRLKNFLITLQNIPITHQQKIIQQEMAQWQGTTSQTDDMLLLGVAI